MVPEFGLPLGRRPRSTGRRPSVSSLLVLSTGACALDSRSSVQFTGSKNSGM